MAGVDAAFLLLAAEIFKDPLESSDDDDEELLHVLAHTPGASTMWSGDKRPRIEMYVERTVAQYSRWEFKSHFRLEIDSFQHLLGMVRNKLSSTGATGRRTISAKKQLMIGIWYMVTPDSYRSVCCRFDVGRATAMRAVRRVTKALFDISPTVIAWPTAEQQEEITAGFEKKNHFPGVIGAIDGTHIKIPAPRICPESYVNRKSDHSIVLQAVCDDKALFTHVNAGHVGSVHDARVFRKSSLLQYMLDDAAVKFPGNTHLIGDPAYPILQHMLVAYKNNGHLTNAQKNYNYCLSSTRTVIERAFGLLKGRCRSLLYLDMRRIEEMPIHIVACCVLHNICQSRGDVIPDDEMVVGAHAVEVEDVPQPLAGNDAVAPHMVALRGLGNAKRIQITNELPQVQRQGEHYVY